MQKSRPPLPAATVPKLELLKARIKARLVAPPATTQAPKPLLVH